MVVSTFTQVEILLKKNLLIMRKTNALIKSLVIPVITFGILYAACIITSYIPEINDNPALAGIALYFIPISLMSVTRQVVYAMVEEKQSKQKEVQKIMGVKQSSYVIGWLLSNLFQVLFVVTIFLLLCIPTKVLQPITSQFHGPSNTQIILGYLMFGLSSVALSYFLSVFFSVPKTAGDVAVLFNVLGDFLIQLLQVEYVQEQHIILTPRNKWVMYLISLFPSTCFTSIVFGNLNFYAVSYEFSANDSLIMLLVDTVFYFTLYVYLDQVIPNEYGTHKKPLFFLQCKTRPTQDSSYVDLSLPLYDQTNVFKPITEDKSSAIYHEKINMEDQIRSVEITDLQKSFGDVHAVNNLTMQIYESQLLCVLGHNGAGKTTTISLVTGLISKDSGSVKFYGDSIDTNLDSIRQYTGICVQRDVLYDELTVEEHLRYYAQMKGYHGPDLEQELQYILTKCCLQSEKNKLSKQLSGGNKRKLSLGMALIGKSKIVFLDEPTSGMDPVTRRAIWDILQEVKQEKRTLILTTHHLDEAEYLSERIAIMAKGKLLTLGSAEFIKRNFGIGYHLNVFKRLDSDNQEWAQKKQRIADFVKNEISGAILDSQTADDVISFMLPTQNKAQFLPIFERLQGDTSITVDLAQTSLEEAFINIGMDEEKFMDRTQQRRKSSLNIQEDNNQEFQEYNDFSAIPVPECLKKPPSYNFMNQFEACFLRKLYTTKFGKRLVVQVLVPIYFEVIAVLIVYLNKNNFSTTEDLLSFACFGVTFELSFGMCISSASVAGTLVLEREQKLKYALNVMGCRKGPYWLATMAFDYFVSAVLILLMIILFAVLGIPQLITFPLVSLYFASQFAFVGFSYLVSWLYTNSNLAFKTIFFLNLGSFMLIPALILLLFQDKVVFWLLALISPIFGLMQGISIDSNIDIAAVENHFAYVFLMIVQGSLSLIFCIYVDSRSLSAPQVENVQIAQVQEQDVIQEAYRVQQPDALDSVKTQNLCKTYMNGFSAVKGTSFGIDKGQVFGLLGPNGAGKSTTFNMITSRLKPTNGQVLLLNQKAEKGNAGLYQNVGVCPQFDCLWDTMTPIEHLKIFAKLKGLPEREVNEAVNYFIRIMQLDAFVATRAQNLSGGNKRKLCVAIALIGSPCIQFFDEPSSGVDPIARRFLWNTIKQGLRLNNSAVVLTTHSMDEAESLCQKIAIQVNGQFVCIGSPQQLKAKYGNGYRITVDVSEGVDIQVKTKERFQVCTVLQSNNKNKQVFQFPNKDFSFYHTFQYFLELQKNQTIVDFSITQSSIEQVFMYFAGFQHIQPEGAFVPKSKGLFTACMGNDEDD